LHSFRTISRIDASLTIAIEERRLLSEFLAKRRQRLSQAMVRSTTQRRGRSLNTWAVSVRLTVSTAKPGGTFLARTNETPRI
jgi:hypothetical protein